MSLRNAALDHGVKCTDTCKLFFGVYPYSLVTAIPQALIDHKTEAKGEYFDECDRRRAFLAPFIRSGAKAPKLPAISPSLSAINREYRDGVNDLIADIVDDNAEALSTGYQVAFNRTNITFYVRDEATATALIEDNPGLFLSVTAPHSTDAQRYLEACADRRIMVRENLFEGKFEYRIDFKRDPEERYDDLDIRVEKLIFHDKSYWLGATRKLYLNGEQDLILARLGLSQHIERITRCVLRDTVSAA